MDPLTTLPEPSFIERDPAVITQAVVQAYEAAAGRSLYPAQPERLMVDQIVYRELLLREGIQDAGKQSLVRFARFPMLDFHGERWGIQRLPAQPARAPFRITLTEPQAAPQLIPAGYRVASKDGAVVFATLEDLVIPAGQPSATVTASAEVSGPQGNGYLPGEVATILSPRPLVASVENVATTSDGLPGEDDDHLRVRVMEAPERVSVAGPSGSYRSFAMGAHPGIVDVGVLSPVPGTANIHVLMGDGLPSQVVLDLVAAAVNSERVRPMCDKVQVLPPTRIPYSLQVAMTARRGADLTVVQAAVQAAAVAFVNGRRKRLGLDLVQSQVVAALMLPGVYSVYLAGWADRVLGGAEWADCTDVTVTLAGVADD